MENELAIRVKILDRIYKLYVLPEYEVTIRQAAKMVNERISEYRESGGLTDSQEVITMALFDTIVSKIKADEEYKKYLTRQNELLEAKVEERTKQLKSSQAQLIQKEKMASLGEMTAGIAHEIQNPLNFVNNFSEVSTELVNELQEGPFQKLPDSEREYANEILSDLTQNLQKITLYGSRASNIVKGMLEHSRASSGETQPTNLNAMADEYFRLAYQGQRAKYKEFDCELITDFDSELGLVDIVPQDIARVLLNLFNNALYAVREKQKLDNAYYRPTIEVSTMRVEENVEIHVSDNGTGIPEDIRSKIFQPFFTTKPTGDNIGLGLSLSYEIISKGYNGSLFVTDGKGEGAEFVIQLPLTRKYVID